MALLLTEIMERLKRLDEVTLLEVLEINSEELVERFTDKIEERADELESELEEFNEEEGLGD